MDGIVEWVDAQRRVIDLVGGLDAQQGERRVPACPDWTVRDLFSHMVGLGVDVLAGDEPNDHNATWTQRQVDERRGHDLGHDHELHHARGAHGNDDSGGHGHYR